MKVRIRTGSTKVAKAVAKARKAKKLSQADLAELTDVSAGTVAGWETARHCIRPNRINAVSRVLDLDPAQLIAWQLAA